jgi:hypothetical protein
VLLILLVQRYRSEQGLKGTSPQGILV